MNANPEALLVLISQLVEQIAALQTVLATLRLAPAGNGDEQAAKRPRTTTPA